MLTCYVTLCEHRRNVSRRRLFSPQPIDNADFIVPVEIEGTTHQVHRRVCVCGGGGAACVCVLMCLKVVNEALYCPDVEQEVPLRCHLMKK